MKTNDAFYWSRSLVIAAWAIFVVSFFLPSFDKIPGWQCAIMQSGFWSQAVNGNWFSIHYLLLTLANLLMLASPFLLTWSARDVRFLKWLRWLGLAAVILVWSFVAELIVRKNGADLKIGCYLWSASFALLFFAALLQTSSAAKKQTA